MSNKILILFPFSNLWQWALSTTHPLFYRKILYQWPTVNIRHEAEESVRLIMTHRCELLLWAWNYHLVHLFSYHFVLFVLHWLHRWIHYLIYEILINMDIIYTWGIRTIGTVNSILLKRLNTTMVIFDCSYIFKVELQSLSSKSKTFEGGYFCSEFSIKLSWFIGFMEKGIRKIRLN